MAQIINGRLAYKVGLHVHTQRSDGKVSYEDAVGIYRAHGYDMIAVTDHWVWNNNDDVNGFPVLSGCEFNVGGGNAKNGVFHILGIGCTEDPECEKNDTAQTIINKIHAKNGIVVLAHPAWSLNTPDMIMQLDGIDMTEIYNTVSTVGMSDRPYSGLIIDMLATDGRIYKIHAADDSHYYDGDDNCVSYVWVYSDSDSREDICRALLKGDFYSTQGPDLDVEYDGESVKVKCSPVSKIAVHSNIVWASNHVLRGNELTSMTYKPVNNETFVRVEVTDKDGLVAWSNIIVL